MKRGAKKGSPKPAGSGRAKGALNKATLIGRERLVEYGGHALELALAIMSNDLKCGVCGGTGMSRYQAGDKSKPRVCLSCHKSGKERIDPHTRLRAAETILDRAYPKLKAVEHSGAVDKPPIGVRVVLVRAKESE